MRELMTRLNHPREEHGIAAIFFGLAITVLVASLGLSIDIGNVAYQRNKAQNAADTTARQLAQSCAKAATSTYDAGVCSALQASAATIAAKSFDTAGGTVTASVPGPNQVKVVVSKDIPTDLLSVIGISSKAVSATATASALGGQPSEGYPVLPLGVSYCTWVNNSGLAGTATEASSKFTVRTDTLQAVNNMLSPVLGGLLANVVPVSGLLNSLTGTQAVEQCPDGTNQILTFQGAVWLVGEQVISGTLGALFNWSLPTCTLKIGTGFGDDLNTFIGGTEGAVFMPPACAAKFGAGKQIQIGSTILLPVYRPYSSLQSNYGLKLLSACGSLLSGKGQTCVEVPPKLGVDVVGFAPFKVTGWNYSSPGPSGWDSSLCSPQTATYNLTSVLTGLVGLLNLVLNGVLSLLNVLTGGGLQLNLGCSGLQGYFTKSFTKDPNFTYTTGAPNFGASYVKLTN